MTIVKHYFSLFFDTLSYWINVRETIWDIYTQKHF